MYKKQIELDGKATAFPPLPARDRAVNETQCMAGNVGDPHGARWGTGG